MKHSVVAGLILVLSLAVESIAETVLWETNTGDSLTRIEWVPVAGESYDHVLVHMGGILDSNQVVNLLRAGPGEDGTPDLVFADPVPTGSEARAFGFDVTTVGDVNGDGYADFVINAPMFFGNGPLGGFYLYHGGPGADTVPDLTVLAAPDSLSYVGFGCVGGGDFNGDGFADFAVSARSGTDGLVSTHLYFGGPSLSEVPDLVIPDVWVRERPYEWFSVLAGDFNADGYADLVGEYHQEGNLGLAILLGGENPDAVVDAVAHPATFTESVSAGDLDGDGIDDLIVSVPGSILVHYGGAGFPEQAVTAFTADPLRFSLSQQARTQVMRTDPAETHADLFTGANPSSHLIAFDGASAPTLTPQYMHLDLAYGIAGSLARSFVRAAGVGPDGTDGLLVQHNLTDIRLIVDLQLDHNNNGIPDAQEVAAGTLADCDGNGLADGAELEYWPQLDCGTDGTIDICQLQDEDCDGDGYTDSCEIRTQGKPDCNLDGIPDECLALVPGYDVDGNSVLDICELNGRLREDCDGNDRSDVWDIIYSPVLDCDRDGFLDSCAAGSGGPPCGPIPYLAIFFDEGLTQTSLDPAALPQAGFLYVAVKDLPPGEVTGVDLFSFSLTWPAELTILATQIAHEGLSGDLAPGPEDVYFWTNEPFTAQPDGTLLLARIPYIRNATPVAGTGVRALGSPSSDVSQARPVWHDVVNGDHRVIDTQPALFGDGLVDCNHNGQSDAEDIALLWSADADGDGIPDECQLSSVPAVASIELNVWPNPFNPRTTVTYRLPEAGAFRLTVYDLTGRRVVTLLDDNSTAAAGSVVWDGRDEAGALVASGVYFLRLDSATGFLTQKMALLR